MYTETKLAVHIYAEDCSDVEAGELNENQELVAAGSWKQVKKRPAARLVSSATLKTADCCDAHFYYRYLMFWKITVIYASAEIA